MATADVLNREEALFLSSPIHEPRKGTIFMPPLCLVQMGLAHYLDWGSKVANLAFFYVWRVKQCVRILGTNWIRLVFCVFMFVLFIPKSFTASSFCLLAYNLFLWINLMSVLEILDLKMVPLDRWECQISWNVGWEEDWDSGRVGWNGTISIRFNKLTSGFCVVKFISETEFFQLWYCLFLVSLDCRWWIYGVLRIG